MRKIGMLFGVVFTLFACGNNTNTTNVAIPEYDEELTATIETLLKAQMDSVSAEAGAVIVKELATGQVKASVDLGDILEKAEHSSLMRVPIYLSMLELGAFTDSTMVDTEVGISVVAGDTVRDHNWRVGGYGEIKMSQGLTFHSNIAMAKAVESNGNLQAINDKLSELGMPVSINQDVESWLTGADTYTPIQLMDTYCQMLNSLKKETRKAMLNNMEACVQSGVLRKLQSDKVNVAAYNSLYPLVRIEDEAQLYKMQICGFVPAEDPQFCIMVCLDKRGLPVSSGSMCSPIFKVLAEKLVSSADE